MYERDVRFGEKFYYYYYLAITRGIPSFFYFLSLLGAGHLYAAGSLRRISPSYIRFSIANRIYHFST